MEEARSQATGSVSAQTWTVDPAHSEVGFSVKHMMFATVRGRFSGVEGAVFGDPTDLEDARIEVRIDARTIDTREEQRDGHLRSADFFDVENHPYITFASSKITHESGDGASPGSRYQIAGDLTIRGVTKPVSLDATFNGKGKDPWGNQRVGFSAEGEINRKDFGLNWNAALEAGGWLVGDQVRLNIETQLVRQASE